MDLKEIRQSIDEIDQSIVELFEKRMNLVNEVASYKINQGLPVLNTSREKEVIDLNVGRLNNPLYSSYLTALFNELMALSRRYQQGLLLEHSMTSDDIVGGLPISERVESPKVAFGGTIGSFGEEAALSYFPEGDLLSCQTFEEVVAMILDESVDYGVLPIENTSSGAILETVTLLQENPLFIVGEIAVSADQCLLGLGSKEDIKRVYSHDQGFLQCSAYLKDKNWQQIPYFNTAISAEKVSKMKDISAAAIASRRAAVAYGLEILEENIHHNKKNFTRFAILKKSLELKDENDKISIDFVLRDEEGTLYTIIKTLTEHNLSMMKIESKPILGRPWEYVFFIDFSGNIGDNNVKLALQEIKEHSLEFHFKGNYVENIRGNYGHGI